MTEKQLRQINRESSAKWASKYDRISAKVGTVPMMVWVPNTAQIEIGKRVEFYEAEWGTKCTGYITATEPRIFIDRC